jgi:hypothetical protein
VLSSDRPTFETNPHPSRRATCDGEFNPQQLSPQIESFCKRLSRRRPSSLPQQRIHVGCLEKYTRVTDPEVLSQSYNEAYQAIDKGGSLTDAGIQAQLADLVKTDPHAKNARPRFFRRRYYRRVAQGRVC